jgi:hypothetical protein
MPRKNDGGFYERAWRKKRGNQRECGYEGYEGFEKEHNKARQKVLKKPYC